MSDSQFLYINIYKDWLSEMLLSSVLAEFLSVKWLIAYTSEMNTWSSVIEDCIAHVSRKVEDWCQKSIIVVYVFTT